MDTATGLIQRRQRRITGLLAEHVEAVSEARPDISFDELRLFLQHELLAYMAAEEAHLCTALEEYDGEATALSLEHEVITRYVRDIEEILYGLETGPTEDESCRLHAQLRKKSVQLQAILELHFELEERVYLPLFTRYVPRDERERIAVQLHPTPAAERFLNT